MYFAVLLNCIELNTNVFLLYSLTDWNGVVKIIETRVNTMQYNSTALQTTAFQMNTQLNQQLSKFV